MHRTRHSPLFFTSSSKITRQIPMCCTLTAVERIVDRPKKPERFEGAYNVYPRDTYLSLW